jgi:hypothetical protein
MLNTARLVPLLLTAWAAPAMAADCLQQIDNITVEFDLPAAQSMSGGQVGDAYYVAPPSDQPFNVPPPATMTPAGRPGAPHAVGDESSLASRPLPAHDRLKPAQRSKLQSILHQARSAEAVGNEPKCYELLREAQAITKEKG